MDEEQTPAPSSDTKARKERSPSFPFIPLKRAVERAQSIYDNHRKEPARLSAIATTWEYGAKSSGLLQTVAALKQFGLVEDFGSGDERKVKLTPLALRILVDAREGAKEQAIAEAARSPRLIAEYLSTWLPERPSDAHCVSELHLDRGFSPDAAKVFLRVFDETIAFANLAESDTLSDGPTGATAEAEEPPTGAERRTSESDFFAGVFPKIGPKPLPERLQVTTTGNRLSVTATLFTAGEVDKLIRILQANKELLEDESALAD